MRRSTTARLIARPYLLGTILLAALFAPAACKPKDGSDLKGIVGYGEDGKLRAFAMLPMRNLPAVDFHATEAPGAQHAIDLATKGQFYGLVECTQLNTGNAEDWMNVVEERAANGDLGILPNRRLLVTGDHKDAFDGTLPCRVIGKFLATLPELDEVLGTVLESPKTVTQRQFRLAQTVFLSIRGPTSAKEEAISPLLQRYLDIAAAHFGVSRGSAAAAKDELMAMDAVFNPCSTEASTLALPAAAKSWRTQNYACVASIRKDAGDERVYRPGGEDGNLYVDVRNFAAAELTFVHMKVLKGAKALNKDVHLLINLLSSTADWTHIKAGTRFAELAEFLSTKHGTNFDFYGIYGNVDATSTESSGLSLTDGDETGFELYPRGSPAFALGTNNGYPPGGRPNGGYPGNPNGGYPGNPNGNPNGGGFNRPGQGNRPNTSNVNPSALIDPRSFADASARDLAPLLGRSSETVNTGTLESFRTAGLTAAEQQAASRGLTTLRNSSRGANQTDAQRLAGLQPAERAALERLQTARGAQERTLTTGLANKFGADAPLGRLASAEPMSRGALESNLEVQLALSQLRAGDRSTRVGNKEFEYLGVTRDAANGDYVALRDKQSGTYHFVDGKSGDTSSWAPINAQTDGSRGQATQKIQTAFTDTNGAKADIYVQQGTNRFQAVSRNGNQVTNTLGILDAQQHVLSYPTTQNKDPRTGETTTISIDWKNEKSQQQVVQQLADTVEKRREDFSADFKKSNPGVSQDTINAMFKMSNSGQIGTTPSEFAKNAEAAGMTPEQMKQLGFKEGENGKFEGSGTTYDKFVAAKTSTYDKALNLDIGKMLTPGDQTALGIDMKTANPDKALTDAFKDQGAGANDQVKLADNLDKLGATDKALFDTFQPTTTTGSTTGNGGAPQPVTPGATVTPAPAAPPPPPPPPQLPTDKTVLVDAGPPEGSDPMALTGDQATALQKCAILKTEAERQKCRDDASRK